MVSGARAARGVRRLRAGPPSHAGQGTPWRLATHPRHRPRARSRASRRRCRSRRSAARRSRRSRRASCWPGRAASRASNSSSRTPSSGRSARRRSLRRHIARRRSCPCSRSPRHGPPAIRRGSATGCWSATGRGCGGWWRSRAWRAFARASGRRGRGGAPPRGRRGPARRACAGSGTGLPPSPAGTRCRTPAPWPSAWS